MLLVSLRFFNPRDDAYCIIWVKGCYSKNEGFLQSDERVKTFISGGWIVEGNELLNQFFLFEGNIRDPCSK